MRKIVLACGATLFMNLLYAQQREGKVIYERTIQLQMQFNDNDAISQVLPKTRTDKFELNCI